MDHVIISRANNLCPYNGDICKNREPVFVFVERKKQHAFVKNENTTRKHFNYAKLFFEFK